VLEDFSELDGLDELDELEEESLELEVFSELDGDVSGLTELFDASRLSLR